MLNITDIRAIFPLNPTIRVGQDAASQHKGEQADKRRLLFTGSHSVIDTTLFIKHTNEAWKVHLDETHH